MSKQWGWGSWGGSTVSKTMRESPLFTLAVRDRLTKDPMNTRFHKGWVDHAYHYREGGRLVFVAEPYGLPECGGDLDYLEANGWDIEIGKPEDSRHGLGTIPITLRRSHA